MKLFFAGDTHGNIKHWEYLIKMCKGYGLNEIYQLGDFGYWEHEFNGDRFLELLNQMLKDAGIMGYWIDGNHENFELLYEKYHANDPKEHEIRSNIIHLGRGYSKVIDGKKFLFCGGADSIDKKLRTKFVSWWPQELITPAEKERVIANGNGVDVLVTHEAPRGVIELDEFLGENNHLWFPESHNHRLLMRDIVLAVKPKMIIHGHYHHFYRGRFPLDYFNYIPVVGLNCDGSGMDSWYIMDTEKI